MTVDEVYTLIQFIVKKNQQGYVKPADFNTAINTAQKQYQSWLLGSFQQYTPGRPIAKVELGNNRTVRQRLAPVIYGYTLHIDPYGYSPYPGDYLQPDAMWSIYGASIYSHKRIRYAQQNQLDAFYNSSIDPIATNPIYLIEDTGFQFYPENQYQARLHYVRDAPLIKWAYTLDGNNRPVYDSVNSIDPVWDDPACIDIVGRCLRMIGVNLQDGAVSQYATELKNVGQ